MNRGKYIVYSILILIPVLAVLLLLALVNVLYMLLGIIVVLLCLIVVKRLRPEAFAWMKRRPPADAVPAPPEPPRPAPSAPKVYLILTERGGGEQRITVDKPRYCIGRGSDNDFSLDDIRIGRRHLRIEYDDREDVCYAVDLGSVNGSYLNSVRMTAGERCRLTQGDRVMLNDRPFDVEYAHY